MRVLMYRDGQGIRPGVLLHEAVIDLREILGEEKAPRDLLELIDGGDVLLDDLRRAVDSRSGSTSGGRALADLDLRAPLDPPRGNIIAIGRNFQAHAEESARARDEEVTPPTVFTKAQTSIIGPYDDVPLDPAVTSQYDWEAELAVVIGRAAFNVPADGALGHVFGYTVLNDLSARDLQFGWGGQFFKGKSLDGSCPLGPWIVTADEIPDPQDLRVRLRLNGETKQDEHTSLMIHTVAELISRLSMGMTLRPGTVIATGTPAGVGMGHTPPQFLKPGDTIETEVEGIGTLRNRVVQVGASS